MAKKVNTVNVTFSIEKFSNSVHRLSFIAFGKNPEAYRFSVLQNDSFEVLPKSTRKAIAATLRDKVAEFVKDENVVICIQEAGKNTYEG
jgi:hypothetical protein